MSSKKVELTVFEKNEKTAGRFHDKGLDYCYVHHEYDNALTKLQKAIVMREALFGKYHNDTALSYFRMSSVLVEAKKEYFDALVVSRREFRISQKLLGDSDFSTLESNEGWLVERKEWISKILLNGSISSKDNHDNKSSSINTTFSKEDAVKYCAQLLQAIEFERLGDAHCKTREWELALTQYNCALALESSSYARNRLDMADIHVKLGDCLKKIGDYQSALEDFQSAESIYKEKFGTQHTTLAIVHSKVGGIHLKLRAYDAALAAYSKAYAIYEEFFGHDHEVSLDALQDIRLVTVKEMEDLRQQERRKKENLRQETRRGTIGDVPRKGLISSPVARHTF